MLISLTASGESKNTIESLKVSYDLKIHTLVLTGQIDKFDFLKYTDIVISVPSKVIPRIEEVHIFISYLICEYVEVERELFFNT